MISGMQLETCWALTKRWNNKFYYKVASCWLFLLSESMSCRLFSSGTRYSQVVRHIQRLFYHCENWRIYLWTVDGCATDLSLFNSKYKKFFCLDLNRTSKKHFICLSNIDWRFLKTKCTVHWLRLAPSMRHESICTVSPLLLRTRGDPISEKLCWFLRTRWRVQRPCNPKPQKEGGDRYRDKGRASNKERSKFRAFTAVNHKITIF